MATSFTLREFPTFRRFVSKRSTTRLIDDICCSERRSRSSEALQTNKCILYYCLSNPILSYPILSYKCIAPILTKKHYPFRRSGECGASNTHTLACKITPSGCKFTPTACKFTPTACKFTPSDRKFTPSGGDWLV
jgi:hypothetical protein